MRLLGFVLFSLRFHRVGNKNDVKIRSSLVVDVIYYLIKGRAALDPRE